MGRRREVDTPERKPRGTGLARRVKIGLRARVLVGFGVALLPMLSFLVLEFRSEERWLERTYLQQQLVTADAVALAVDRQLDTSIELGWAIALDGRTAALDTAANDAYLHTLVTRDPLVTTLAVFDRQGTNRGYAISGARPPEPRPSVGDRPWFREALGANVPVVADVLDARRSPDLPGVVVAVPLRDPAGLPIGVAIVATNTEALARQYRQLTAWLGLAVVLTDDHGTLAFHTEVEAPTVAQVRAYEAFPPVLAALGGTPTIVERFRSPALGDERMGAFVRSHRHHWGVAVTMRRDDALVVLRERQRNELGVLLGSAALTVALGVFVAGVLVRPLRDLDAAARALGAGDLTRRVRVHTDDEVGRVAASFNEMAARLEERSRDLERSQEEFRTLNAQLEARVHARTEELESINRELEAFSYSVSHDLRAPLRAVEGFVAAALDDFRSELPTEAVAYLDRARAGARRMSGLIDGLLALSRAARTPLTRMWVDMAALAREVCDEAAGTGPGRPEIVIGSIPPAWGDPVLLRQVLSNLVGNAVKYTRGRTPARIEVGYSPGPPGAWFVKDNGIGFDPARAQKLFQPFQRLDQPREFEGSGIGLAIVQRVVARHGGRVWADGKVGEGATFCFTIGGGPGA